MSTSPGPWPPRTRPHALVGIAGYAQSGKDTAAKELVEHGWVRAGFADALRAFAVAINPVIPVSGRARVALARKHPGTPWEVVRTILVGNVRLAELVNTWGWDVAKVTVPEVRALMQRIGTEGGRKVLGGDIWVRTLLDRLPDAPVVITDVRFHNEVDAIEAAGGMVIRIARPGIGPVNAHPSETEIDQRAFAHIITNDGTIADLRASIAAILLPEERANRAA